MVVPIAGAEGTPWLALITTLADEADVHPAALVTVKLYVPAARPEIVVLVPVPVIAPGLIVHVPDAGRPVNNTLPVGVAQVGWVIVDNTIAGLGLTVIVNVFAVPVHNAVWFIVIV